MNLISPVAEQSVVSFPRTGMTFTENKSAWWHISVLSLHWQTLSSRMVSQMRSQRAVLPFSRKSLRRCASSFPRPMTQSSHHGAGGEWFTMWCCPFHFRRLSWTREDLSCHLFCSHRQLLPPRFQILVFLLLLGCDLFIFTQPSEEDVLRPVNRGSQLT